MKLLYLNSHQLYVFFLFSPMWIINEINAFHIFRAEVLIKSRLFALHFTKG